MFRNRRKKCLAGNRTQCYPLLEGQPFYIIRILLAYIIITYSFVHDLFLEGNTAHPDFTYRSGIFAAYIIEAENPSAIIGIDRVRIDGAGHWLSVLLTNQEEAWKIKGYVERIAVVIIETSFMTIFGGGVSAV